MTFVVALPLLVVLLAFCVEAGRMFYVRSYLQAVADHAALAAVQELDYERLAEGTIMLLPDSVQVEAEHYLLANFRHSSITNWVSLPLTRVHSYNASPDEPTVDGWTGRSIDYPTVCIVLRAEVESMLPMPFAGGGKLVVPVVVHADASVEPRER